MGGEKERGFGSTKRVLGAVDGGRVMGFGEDKVRAGSEGRVWR